MLSKAYFGGGCFWCTQVVFQKLSGVKKVVAGYSGGDKKNPTYEDVISEVTHHIETVEVIYDKYLISYDILLAVFFSTHDPTTMDRQGADIGEMYRSVIFYTNESEKDDALIFIKKLNSQKIFNNAIVTKVLPFVKFYSAEDYHQNYYEKNRDNFYCRIVINPKLEKLEKLYKEYLK